MPLLLGTIGILAYHLFIVVGTHGLSSSNLEDALKNIATPNNTLFTNGTVPLLTVLVCSISVFSVVEVTLQTFIIIIANSDSVHFCSSISRAQPMMSMICWCLAFVNALSWLDCSLTRNVVGHTNPIKELVFTEGKWETISEVLLPIVMFYQHHSVHLLYTAGHELQTSALVCSTLLKNGSSSEEVSSEEVSSEIGGSDTSLSKYT